MLCSEGRTLLWCNEKFAARCDDDKQRSFTERFTSLPFDDVAAEHYARIRADLARAGTPIGPNDLLLIAAIALANALTLVTHNMREFGRVVGLKIEDWEAETT